MSENSETLGDTLVWRIKKFSFCLLKKDEYLETSLPPSANSPKFNFRLYPFGKTEGGEVMPLCMTLEWKDDIEDGILCFTMSLVSKDGFFYSENGADEIMFLEPGVARAVPLRSRDKLSEKSSLYLPKDTLTVYCHIWNPEKRKEAETIYRFCTEIPTIQYAGMWKIEKFSAWLGEEKKFPISGTMYAVISLQKKYQKSPVEEDIVIDLYHGNISASFLKSTVLIFRRKRTTIKKISFSSEKRQHYFSRLIAKKEILNNRSLYLQDDTLILQFVIHCDTGGCVKINNAILESVEVSSARIPVIKAQIKKDKKSVLADDLLGLYTEKICGDVTLRADGWQCLAHISILSARSPVFRAMFQHETVEATSKIVNISDISADTLHRMLCFMYANRFRKDMTVEDAIELFVAADKYQIQHLKTLCFDFIKSGLSVKNVCKVLGVADFRRELDLKNAALDFIAMYRDGVLNSPEWEDFKADQSELAAETMEQMCIPKQYPDFDYHRKRSFAEMSEGCSSRSDTIVAECSKTLDNSPRKELAVKSMQPLCTSGIIKKKKLFTDMSDDCGSHTGAAAAECSKALVNSCQSELTSLLKLFCTSRFGVDIKKPAFTEMSKVYGSPINTPKTGCSEDDLSQRETVSGATGVLDLSKLSTDNKEHPSAEVLNGCDSYHDAAIAGCSKELDNSPGRELSSETTDRASELNTDNKKQLLPEMSGEHSQTDTEVTEISETDNALDLSMKKNST